MTGNDNGTLVASSIRVPPNGFSGKQYAILTNDDFIESGAISARFEWDTDLRGGEYRTTDHVRLAPSKTHFVRESEPGSGAFVVVDAHGLPTYLHTDGVGAGAIPLSMCSDGHVRFNLTLTDDLRDTVADVVEISVENATGEFEGSLTETAPGSGVFADAESLFTMIVTPVVTSATTHDTLYATVTCAALGLNDTQFSLVEGPPSTIDSLGFCTLAAHAGVTLAGPLDPAAIDTITVQLGTTVDGPNIMATLTETDVDSEVFVCPDNAVTLTITGYTHPDPTIVDSFTVLVSTELLSIPTFTLTVNETEPDSLDFHSFAATSGTGRPSIDITPLNPETSGQGVFYVEVTAAATSPFVEVTVDAGVDNKTVNAYPVGGNVFRTQKLVLVEEGTDPTYSGIITLCSASVSPVITATVFGAPQPAPILQSAFIGSGLSGWGANLDEIEKKLTDNLGWTVTKNHVLKRSVIMAEGHKHDLWYSLQHGVTTDGTVATKVERIEVWAKTGWKGEQVGPDSIGAYVGVNEYKLVFLNGCSTASTVGGTDDFADAFNAEAYIGWEASIMAGTAARAGRTFFEHTDGGKTVFQAITAVKAAGRFSDLRVVRGGGVTIDLTP